jgi:Flp pilus assembly protein TadG
MIVHGFHPESFADWVEMGKHFTRVMGRFLASVRLAAKDRRGSAISMMAAGLIPVVAALGSGIDAARMYVVKSQLQAGVDAAALAGARAFAVTDDSAKSRTKQVEAYFYGNFPNSPPYMGVTNLKLTPAFATVNGINLTTVTAEAVVPMSFMGVFGVSGQKMTAVAKAELQPRPLEVMVVLDDTGSMRANLSAGRTRETALKEAAKDFVDILHQGATSRRDLALGFIGYDVTVNVGHLLPAGAVATVDGFNDTGTISRGGDWKAGNRYAWKGCVMNDTTVKDVNSDRTYSETGAWDLTRLLPNEGGNPPVQPYFIPPMWVPKLASGSADAAQRANPAGDYYKVASVEPDNNMYRLDWGTTGATYLADKEIYKKHFYEYYIGLNNGSADSANDVIRKLDGSYYIPGSSDAWYVDLSRIPNYSSATYWRTPSDGKVNQYGGRVDNINNDRTPMPTPNWQCPEEAMPIEYGRAISEYKTRIDEKHAAIYPGNGTIHHAGLLWGYRLLVRDDIFTRVNPTNERPRRAIVFMTDGENQVAESQNGYIDRTYTWYGRWSDSSISANQTNTETQMMRRFEKTCANIHREVNPPEVYIISLVAEMAVFETCAPGRVYQTSSTDQLKKAFQDVAAELVDLHLVQ